MKTPMLLAAMALVLAGCGGEDSHSAKEAWELADQARAHAAELQDKVDELEMKVSDLEDKTEELDGRIADIESKLNM